MDRPSNVCQIDDPAAPLQLSITGDCAAAKEINLAVFVQMSTGELIYSELILSKH